MTADGWIDAAIKQQKRAKSLKKQLTEAKEALRHYANEGFGLAADTLKRLEHDK